MSKWTLLFVSSALLAPVLLLSVMQPLRAGADEKEAGKKRLLRHVVLFQFKESASEEDVQKIVAEFDKLPKSIDSIVDYERGVNNSPEGLNEGLTHAFIVTFDSEEGRDAYLPHPAHQAFVKQLRPHLEKAVVVDYWVE